MRQFVTRYKDKISAVEVWNEEAHDYFWTGTAEQYAALLTRTYTTVKAVDSSIKVVLGGLTTISADFSEMGRLAARMILDRSLSKIHCPFGMTRRSTF